jgi:hypothetical protein
MICSGALSSLVFAGKYEVVVTLNGGLLLLALSKLSKNLDGSRNCTINGRDCNLNVYEISSSVIPFVATSPTFVTIAPILNSE